MGILNFIPNLLTESLLVPLACENAVASGKVTKEEAAQYMRDRRDAVQEVSEC